MTGQRLKARDHYSNSNPLKDHGLVRVAPVPIDNDKVHKVVPSNAKLWAYLTIDQVARAMKYLLEEILELAGNNALDNGRTVLVPSDVRTAINFDPQFCEEGLNRSQVFWPPDMIVARAEE